jgi:hypothetical protein
MSAKLSSPDRRQVLAASATVVASSLIPAQAHAATTSDAIRPFRVDVPQEELVELRRRILATRWPERETVTDESQGVPLTMIQELARYWGTDYDWRKCEAKLNALPQFMTEIDGLDIHFIHVRSKDEKALPLIVTQCSVVRLHDGTCRHRRTYARSTTTRNGGTYQGVDRSARGWRD